MAKGWCLIKQSADKLIEKLKKKEYTYASLRRMSSDARRSSFEKIMSKEDAKRSNILFEKKLLQKDFFKAMDTWQASVTGIPTKRMAKIREMIAKRKEESTKKLFNPKDEESFMKDLAEAKVGVGISSEEAKMIYKLTNAARDTKNSNYGEARVALENFIGDVKVKAIDGEFTTKEYWQSLWKDGGLNATQLGKITVDLFGAMKSVVASLDQSFIGRQGGRVLLSGEYENWAKMAKNSLKTAYDVVKLPSETMIDGKKVKLSDNSVVKDGIKASIYNRENGRNGIYEKMKLAVGINEEAFPNSLPSKIPGLGRFFKASEDSYTAAAYMLRADLADKYIKEFPEILTDKKMAESFGRMINSMTGRGEKFLGKLGTTANTALFSPKFIQSSLDVLTAHTFDGEMSSAAKSVARKNWLKMASSMLGIGAAAEFLFPGSVETDPRSSDFGKIRIGDTRYDFTGGLAGYITLVSRLAKGVKSSSTGIVTKPGDYGGKDVVGVLSDFAAAKTSPGVRLMLDIANGKNFDGDPMDIESLKENPTDAVWILGKSFIPLSTKQFYNNLKDGDEVIWSSVLADFFGVSSNTYTYSPNWESSSSKELAQFKEKVGSAKFKEANKEFSTTVNSKLLELRNNEEYNKASDSDKKKIINNIQSDAKSAIFKKNSFNYKTEKSSEVVKKLSK